jgi:predicted RNA-binding Zn-ribbon protein involved in translation (DUF1610 family)
MRWRSTRSYAREVKVLREEPDAIVPHVRICGSPGRAIAQGDPAHRANPAEVKRKAGNPATGWRDGQDEKQEVFRCWECGTKIISRCPRLARGRFTFAATAAAPRTPFPAPSPVAGRAGEGLFPNLAPLHQRAFAHCSERPQRRSRRREQPSIKSDHVPRMLAPPHRPFAPIPNEQIESTGERSASAGAG